MSGLPQSVRGLAELSPVEDIMLYILRKELPGVTVGSLIVTNQTFPFVLVRRGNDLGSWRGDERFVDSAGIMVGTFVSDPNGDEDAAILAEAVRVTLRDAARNNTVAPGRGWLRRIDMTSAPRRVTDWATATGPVQYADLPTGVWRYETTYRAVIRKPRARPFIIPTP